MAPSSLSNLRLEVWECVPRVSRSYGDERAAKACCPLRLDLRHAPHAGGVVADAATPVLLGRDGQSPLHGIACFPMSQKRDMGHPWSGGGSAALRYGPPARRPAHRDKAAMNRAHEIVIEVQSREESKVTEQRAGTRNGDGRVW